MIVNQAESQHELKNVWATSRKVREFVYEFICSSTPKENALRNFIKYNKDKISN